MIPYREPIAEIHWRPGEAVVWLATRDYKRMQSRSDDYLWPNDNLRSVLNHGGPLGESFRANWHLLRRELGLGRLTALGKPPPKPDEPILEVGYLSIPQEAWFDLDVGPDLGLNQLVRSSYEVYIDWIVPSQDLRRIFEGSTAEVLSAFLALWPTGSSPVMFKNIVPDVCAELHKRGHDLEPDTVRKHLQQLRKEGRLNYRVQKG